ncbi:YugN family protein [Thalassobacillus devorans]|uniref:YugN family protein n=1 Tax=Thalassobacillus devorans TaxID=279813 RepID=UPI00048CE059|nr:YugN family protein [Thalassobacillus devorans]
MKLEATGIEGLVIKQKPLHHILNKAGFIRGGQWDYERVTYDYKIGSPEKNITYYVRIQGYAIEGEVDSGTGVFKMLAPLLGRHYYPHGVEYGEQEGFSQDLVDRANKLVTKAAEDIKKHQEAV